MNKPEVKITGDQLERFLDELRELGEKRSGENNWMPFFAGAIWASAHLKNEMTPKMIEEVIERAGKEPDNDSKARLEAAASEILGVFGKHAVAAGPAESPEPGGPRER